VSHIASCLLIKINEYLRALKSKNKKDKENLEYLLGNILKQLLIQIINRLPKEGKIKFTTVTYIALQDTCKLYNYNFAELMMFLNVQNTAFEKSVSYNAAPPVNISGPTFKETPAYVWISGSTREFDAFIKLAKKYKIT